MQLKFVDETTVSLLQDDPRILEIEEMFSDYASRREKLRAVMSQKEDLAKRLLVLTEEGKKVGAFDDLNL